MRSLYSLPTHSGPRSPNLMSWVQRLKRVFAIDIETCLNCGGKPRMIVCIEEPALIARILGHVHQLPESDIKLARAQNISSPM